MEEKLVRVVAVVPPADADTQCNVIIELVSEETYNPAKIMVQVGDVSTVVSAHHLISAVKAARHGGRRY